VVEMGRISSVRQIASVCASVSVASCGALPHGPSGPALDNRFELERIGAQWTGSREDTSRIHKCYAALRRASEPYGVMHIAIESAGAPRADRTEVAAPYLVTMSFNGLDGGPESRTAVVDCRFNAAGEVAALSGTTNRERLTLLVTDHKLPK
jgi:hypothetical protein